MSAVALLVTGIVSAVGAVTSAGVGFGKAAQAKRKGLLEEAKERAAQKKLEAFERSRQAVINQASAIRGLKSQVFNPFANMAVANKAAQLQIEQTDEALANTLDSINQSGTGAGGATALARMAAMGKAQISASLEKQEVANHQQRISGDARVQSQKMQLEQAALSEETAAWSRQETRDVVSLDRLAGLQENAQAQAMAYQQGADALTMSAISGLTEGLTTAATSFTGYAKYGGGGGSGGSGGGGKSSGGGGGGAGAGSDRRLKKNIKLIGISLRGLNIYKFEYKNLSFGQGIYQGVMSDEIPKEAVIIGSDGFDRVDYSKLDVEFKKL